MGRYERLPEAEGQAELTGAADKGYTKSLVMLVDSIALAYWHARGGRCQFNASIR